MKYLSMLERLDEGELVRAEDSGWLEELEVVHIIGLGVVGVEWNRSAGMTTVERRAR